jgi:hypothetical protein
VTKLVSGKVWEFSPLFIVSDWPYVSPPLPTFVTEFVKMEIVGDMNKNKYKLRSMYFEHEHLPQVCAPLWKNKTCRDFAFTSPPF